MLTVDMKQEDYAGLVDIKMDNFMEDDSVLEAPIQSKMKIEIPSLNENAKVIQLSNKETINAD